VSYTRQFRRGMDEMTSRRMNTKSVPVVSATTDIPTSEGLGPFNGQVVFNTADNMLYRYDAAALAWVAVGATGGGFLSIGSDAPTRSHEARYFATVAQSIPNITDTKIQFPSVFANAAADITPSGVGNTDFLLNRGGVWAISASLRYVVVATVGTFERHLFLQTGTVFNAANRFAFTTEGNPGTTSAISLNASTTIRLAAGTSVFAAGFQNTGGAINTDPVAVGVHGFINIGFVWLRP
jgi:hypothetical protein